MNKKPPPDNKITEVVRAIDFCRASSESAVNAGTEVTELLAEREQYWMEKLYRLSGGKYPKLDEKKPQLTLGGSYEKDC